MNTQQLQLAHYERIIETYEAHYDDPWSQAYRRWFIYGPLFRGIELAGRRVLEAMCGSGQTTAYLLARGAEVTGLDISESAMRSFRRRWPECPGVCASILDCPLDDELFDCVVVIGGLHHLHPHVDLAIREIHRVLKPGGYFCFMEPHRGSWADVVRRAWYRRDTLFAPNEAAIDLDTLQRQHAGQWRFGRPRYFGNVAYLGVLNSMVLRIPLGLKPWYAPLLMPAEWLVSWFQGRLLSCCVLGRWQKRP